MQALSTKVLRWKGGAFAHFMIDWATTALAATTDPLTLLSMGIEGDIHVFQGAIRSREHIPGPGHLGPLRDMRLIAGDYYAAGMQRQVYRRRGEHDWVSIADAICEHERIKGFNSIDGYSAHELYAAGLDGELWRFDGQHWQRVELPTRVALQRVHCSDNGMVCVVGQEGVVLTGRRDQWRFVERGDLCEDLWGVQRFNDQLFVASSSAVHHVDDGQLAQAAIDAERVGAASSLTAADGVLC